MATVAPINAPPNVPISTDITMTTTSPSLESPSGEKQPPENLLLRSQFTWRQSPLTTINELGIGILHSSRSVTINDSAVVWLVKFFYLVAVALIGLVIWQLVELSASYQVLGWGIAFIAVAIAVPLSFYDASRHLTRMSSPLQVHYVRCILMVPIFAIESFLALRYTEQRHVLEALRSIYECFVIAAFFHLMTDYFGGKEEAAAVLAARTGGNGKVTMFFPLNYPPFSWAVPAWRIDRESRGHFVNICRTIIAVYVVVQWMCVIINLITIYYGEEEGHDIYCETSNSKFLSCIHPWTSWILLFWQCAAVYALVIFYHELKPELDHLEALPKLFVVKLVVFVSFWQGIFLSLLISTDVITASELFTPAEIALGIQNFTICIEMAFAALLHHRYFSQAEFAGERGIKSGVLLYSAGALSPFSALRALNPMPILKESAEILWQCIRGTLSFEVPIRPQFDHWAAGLAEKIAAAAAAAAGGSVLSPETETTTTTTKSQAVVAVSSSVTASAAVAVVAATSIPPLADIAAAQSQATGGNTAGNSV
jgi:hypothetical protein